MSEFDLNKVVNSTLKELILPINSYFEQFISNDKQLVLKRPIDNSEHKSSNTESKVIFFKKIKEIRKKIELVYSNEYLEKRVIEIKNKSIVDSIKKLNKFCMENDYKILQSLSYSLLTNVKQFVELDSTLMTPLKWRKIFYAYLSTMLVVQNIEEIKSARIGDSSKKIILSLGLIDQTSIHLNASNEIKKMIDISNQSNNFIVIPVCNCSSRVFSRILKEFSRIDILHIAGHGDEDSIQFSDCDMKYPIFCDTLKKFNHYFDLIFLNCCHTFDFVLKKKVKNSKETIVHNKEVNVGIAIDFATHYYMELMLQNTISFKNSWNCAKQHCTENPFKYHRLQ